MNRDKRRWIYTGLGIPAGVAVATRPRAPLSRRGRGRVLLIGNEIADGLGPPLSRLAADARVPILVDGRAGTAVRDWYERGWVAPHLATYRPVLVLLALEPAQGAADMRSAIALDKAVRASGAGTLWLPRQRPPVLRDRSVVAPQLHLGGGGDTMTPTVAGYAAWAAHVWRATRPQTRTKHG